MGTDTPNSVLGVVIAVVGIMGSILVARMSRTKEPAESGPSLPAPGRAELTTIAGLAAEMVRLRDRVAELESGNTVLTLAQAAQQEHARRQDETTGALRRYVRRLETALRELGAAVPDPDPADAHLIRAS